MSVIEKAGAEVLNATFGKPGEQQAESKIANDLGARAVAPKKPQPLALDFTDLAAKGFYNPQDRSSQLALELRAVKRRLLRRIGYLRASGDRQAFRASGRQRNIVLVTSTRAGEGKTFSSINLALSLAYEDRIETLLVDADLMRPKIRERLSLPFALGLSDRIREESLAAASLGWRVENAPLSILPEGSRADRPTELFSTAEAQSFFAELAAADPNRIIIVDAPPVLATTDAVVLGKYADEIVFVVEANTTPEPAVAAAIDELIEVNPNVSLMLNRCQIGAGGAHYGSYEYYGRGDSADAQAPVNARSEG
ncbi:MAG: hypothetical protein R3C58_06730 [Parvularculaceae bacterium]